MFGFNIDHDEIFPSTQYVSLCAVANSEASKNGHRNSQTTIIDDGNYDNDAPTTTTMVLIVMKEINKKKTHAHGRQQQQLYTFHLDYLVFFYVL